MRIFMSVLAGINGGLGFTNLYLGNYFIGAFGVAVALFILCTIETKEEE